MGGAEEQGRAGGAGPASVQGGRPGEPFQGEGEGAGLVQGAGDPRAAQVMGGGPGGIAAEFGEEAELGVQEVVTGRRGDVGVGGADAQQVRLGRVDVAGAPRAEGRTHVGVDLAVLVALFDGDPAGLLVQFAGAVEVVGEQCQAAEPGQPRRHLGLQAQLPGDLVPFLLPVGRPRVLPLDLGEHGERRDGRQLTPAVAQFAEEGTAAPSVAGDRVQVTADQGERRPQAERGGGAPPVVRRLDMGLTIAGTLLLAVAAAGFGVLGDGGAPVYVAAVLWGLGWGGLPTLLQTAVGDAGGDRADAAQAMLVTLWNVAMAGGGVLGGVLLDAAGSGSFPWTLLVLLLPVLAVVLAARAHGFPSRRRVT